MAKNEKNSKHLNILNKTQLENICFTLMKYLAKISNFREENSNKIAALNKIDERFIIDRNTISNLNSNNEDDLNNLLIINKEISEKEREIKTYIEKLQKEKAILNEKFNGSLEKMAKLSNMVKNEEENYRFYLKQDIEFPLKVEFIMESSKQLDENILTKEKKLNQISETKNFFTQDINKMQDIFYSDF